MSGRSAKVHMCDGMRAARQAVVLLALPAVTLAARHASLCDPPNYCDLGAMASPPGGLIQQSGSEYLSEQDLVLRTSAPPSRLQMKRTARSRTRTKADLFYAFDTALGSTARRAVTRRWLADVRSTSKLAIAHRFFSDGPLPDANSTEAVTQPKENRLPLGADVTNRWSSRWLYDMKWTLKNIDAAHLIRADDDGFQCGTSLANLLRHLPQSGPLMVFSSSEARIDRTTGSSPSGGVFYTWPLERRQFAHDFEENWMLLSRPMAQSMLDVLKVERPRDEEILPDFVQRLYRSDHWPPRKSVILDVGRFDNDTSYSACAGVPAAACTQGFNVWDSSYFKACKTYQDCDRRCREDGLLWLHHVENVDMTM